MPEIVLPFDLLLSIKTNIAGNPSPCIRTILNVLFGETHALPLQIET